MHRTVLFALVVVAIAGCAAGGMGASLPTPPVTITPPAPDLAPELAAFSGTWEGIWDGVLLSRLTVEQIDTNSARVVYIWDNQPTFGRQAGWSKHNANVVPPAKIQFGSNIRFTFTMSKDQMSIQGERETQGRVNTVTMRKATWVKGNGPAAFAPPAPGTESAPAAIPPVIARRTPPPVPAPGGGGTSRSEFTFKVTYRVKGTAGSAMLTFRDRQGGTVQMSARPPWEISFDARDGAFLHVGAQNEGVTGSVTCEIEMDGESRSMSTSTGAYVLAECSNMAEQHGRSR